MYRVLKHYLGMRSVVVGYVCRGSYYNAFHARTQCPESVFQLRQHAARYRSVGFKLLVRNGIYTPYYAAIVGRVGQHTILFKAKYQFRRRQTRHSYRNLRGYGIGVRIE